MSADAQDRLAAVAYDALEELAAQGDGNPDHWGGYVIVADVERMAAHVAAALAPVVAEARAEAWDEAVQALAWALDNGPSDRALPYVAEHNPYRTRADREQP